MRWLSEMAHPPRWFGCGAVTGAITAAQRADFIAMGYREQIGGLASFLRSFTHAELHLGWPSILGLPLSKVGEVILKFLRSPVGSITTAIGLVMDVRGQDSDSRPSSDGGRIRHRGWLRAAYPNPNPTARTPTPNTPMASSNLVPTANHGDRPVPQLRHELL